MHTFSDLNDVRRNQQKKVFQNRNRKSKMNLNITYNILK